MTRKLFGTDGIRGTANQHPMTAEIALKVGMAAGQYFNRGDHRHRVVIAKDTRLSGYMLEPALTSGFIATGMDVILVGPLPTPAVAMLVRSMRADLGVMISASHNPYEDNGIKLFGPNGFKLSDEVEKEIELLIEKNGQAGLAEPKKLGRAQRLEDARGRYIEFVKASFPKTLTLDGLKIVIDCAHGAAYQVGPIVLRELGAQVIALGTAPDGFNINKDCGSTHPEALSEAVRKHQADLGIALDGDADRVILCDEQGELIDGDQLLAMIAESWLKDGKLKGGAVVGTQMSNLGFEKFLGEKKLKLIRAQVGDRYVIEAMREQGCNLGGEPSGHVICSDYATTGDGLMAALQALAVMRETGRKLSSAGKVFTPYAQVLKNVRFTGASPLENPEVQKTIREAEQGLGGKGRIFVRKSGTEPLIRVMVEGDDHTAVEKLAASVSEKISSV